MRSQPTPGCRKPISGDLMAPLLEIEDVYTAYDKADVLCGVSLTVEARGITCLLGSNGSGKTTVVRSILGLTQPRAGRIIFNGHEITRLPTHRIAAHERKGSIPGPYGNRKIKCRDDTADAKWMPGLHHPVVGPLGRDGAAV